MDSGSVRRRYAPPLNAQLASTCGSLTGDCALRGTARVGPLAAARDFRGDHLARLDCGLGQDTQLKLAALSYAIFPENCRPASMQRCLES